jgi:hypothetical protein
MADTPTPGTDIAQPKFIIRKSKAVPGKLSLRRADNEQGSVRDLIMQHFDEGDIVMMVRIGRKSEGERLKRATLDRD